MSDYKINTLDVETLLTAQAATISVAGLQSPADKTKLDSVAANATANSTDAQLRDRSTHTGTQPANTVTGLAAVATSGLKADVGLGNVDNTSDANKPVSGPQQTALNLKYDASNPNGYETPAQLNTRDTNNRARANHTGTQTASTISDFSTAADARITAQKGAANGLATLGADSKIPSSQLPAIAISDTFVVASQAAQVALTAETGDVAVRTDLNKSYILRVNDPTIFANWQELLTPTDAVLSVNGQTGTVVLTTTNIAEGTGLYFTTARVLATVLAGLNTALTGVITAGDTVLQALGRLQNQASTNATNISNNAAAIATKENTIAGTTSADFWSGAKTFINFATTVRATVLTGLSLATGTAITAADTVLSALGKLQNQASTNATNISNNAAAINAKVFGNNAEDFVNATAFNTTTLYASPVVASTFTTASKPIGRYRILIKWNFTYTSISSSVRFWLFVDGVQQEGVYEKEPSDNTDDELKHQWTYMNFASVATHTIQLRCATEAGGTLTVSRCTAEIWRVS